MARLRWVVIAVCLTLFVSVFSAAQTSGPVQYVYDDLGRLVAVIDANGNAAAYSYDAVGNILSITRYTSTQVSVISFSPNQGPVGTPVTIYGTGFSATPAQNTVQFNGVTAAVTSSTVSQIVTSVPAGATTGLITVTTPLGSTTSASVFTVGQSLGAPTITGFTPAVGVPGAAITINGTNFELLPANNRFRLNSVASSPVTSSTSTAITTTVPAGAGSGQFTVSTPRGVAVGGDFFVPFSPRTAADVGYTGRTTIGATQSVTLAPSKIALLVFDATDGQRINVQLSGSTFVTPTLYLFRPDGTQLSTGSTSIADTLLPTPGSYSIGIITGGGGSAGVQLNHVSDISGTIAIDGSAVTTTTTTAGQDVFLKFAGVAGQQIVLTVTSVTNPSATIAMLGPTGQAVTLQPGNLTINNNPAGQTFFLDNQTLPMTGTYTLWVQHSGTSFGNETLQVSSAPDIVAQIIPGGAAVRVPAIGDTLVGQNARLTFSGVKGHRVSMNITGGTYPSSSCNLSLINPAGTAVTWGLACWGATNPFVDSITLQKAGTYTILVDPAARTTGHTTVQLNDSSDVTGTIAIDGSPVTATTTVQGQDARLTFSATAGQRIVLQASNVTNSVTVFLVKPDGTTQTSLWINNSPGTVYFLDTQTLATTGTYTLWVQHSGTTVGSETLLLNSVPADFTAPITIGGSAVRVPTTGNTSIGQNATLSFSANAGQKVSLNITSGTYATSSSCRLTLRSPTGTNLNAADCGTGAPSYLDTVVLNTTGVHTIFVDPYTTATGSTTVQINDDTDVTGTIAIDGAPVTTTTIRGQDARLTFSGTAGQQIVLLATNVTIPPEFVKLLKPDGSSQASLYITNSPAGQTFFLDTQTLATTGTYTLWVQHIAANAGSGTLQILSVPADFTGSLTINGASVRVPASGNTVMGQNASVTFTATAGQSLKINFSGSTYTPGTAALLTLKNPSGGTVTSGWCGNPATSPISATAATTGTYTIIIDPQGASTGTVTISVTSP